MFSRKTPQTALADDGSDVQLLEPEFKPDERRRLEKQVPAPKFAGLASDKESAIMPLDGDEPAETGPPLELDRLREILFGSQSRAAEKRMADLDSQLTALRQEMRDLVESRFTSLSNSASAQVDGVNRGLSDRLTRQANDQAAQLRAAQKSLTDQMQTQHTELTAQARTNRRELTDKLEAQHAELTADLQQTRQDINQRLDTLTADFLNQLRQIQAELNTRLDETKNKQSERLQNLESETRQRDDALRQELLLLASQLDDGKVSRLDMGQILVEMGRRLRREA
jgi:DNA anti-recombination protein RmuC